LKRLEERGVSVPSDWQEIEKADKMARRRPDWTMATLEK
jgi:hypothetical protein